MGVSKKPSKKSAKKSVKSTVKAGEPKVTPAMRQFHHFKDKYPECILLFRMGDFYEMFYDDAKLAHRVLGVTLTQRSEGVPMAGVPFHSVEGYLRRLIQAGYRVAICDQVEDPKEAKGVVKREVTRIVTPGTLTDDYLLEENSAKPLASIYFTSDDASSDAHNTNNTHYAHYAHLSWVDLSTGSFQYTSLPAAEALDELARIRPSEILLHEENLAHYCQAAEIIEPASETSPDLDLDGATNWFQGQVASFAPSLSPRSELDFDVESAAQTLRSQYQVKTLQGFGMMPESTDHDAACVCSMGAILRYLKETQFTYEKEKEGSRHLLPPRRFNRAKHLVIDETSLRSLEIEVTARSGETDHSLVSTFLRGGTCKTAMGKRLMRTWLCYPLNDLDEINDRLNKVDALLQDDPFRDELRERLDQIHDLPRICTRVAMNRATPRDLVALSRSTGAARELFDLLITHDTFKAQAQSFEHALTPLEALANLLSRACVDTPPAHMREGGLVADGFDPELDECRLLQRDSQSWLAEYQGKLAAEIGLNQLKVGYNKVFGYYIELSAAQKDKAPEEWIRKQTLKNAERFITQELKTFEGKVLSANERAVSREQRLFNDLCHEAQNNLDALRQFADMAASLDVLQAFASRARKFGYVKPTMTEHRTIEINGGRHPVLDETLRESFVPNDLYLGTGESPESQDRATFALITGPNMAGKSTFIRQAALLTLLAHAGCFVPAADATIGLCDRIFTRIGASDELHSGQSTFMVEMVETARICNEATENSLIILDEIGRGTSTYDGLSLAWSITEHLAQLGARTLFATHYHELTELGMEDNVKDGPGGQGQDRIKRSPVGWPRICNLNVSVREWQGDIVFMHQIIPGATNRSYGIHVAKIAGLPSPILSRAQQILRELEAVDVNAQHKKTYKAAPAPTAAATPGADELATEDAPIATQAAQPAPPQLSLFAAEEHPAVSALKKVQLDSMTPLQAFDLIRQLKEQV